MDVPASLPAVSTEMLSGENYYPEIQEGDEQIIKDYHTETIKHLRWSFFPKIVYGFQS